MSESFNPYVQWLGYTGGQRPTDYYELLGLDRFQNDPAAIGHAADVLTSQIRRVRPGPQLAAWQDLLDQLRLAKICLLDPVSKAAYDASLRSPPQPAQVEAVHVAPPMATPPPHAAPILAVPPTSGWGVPRPSSPAAPQIEPPQAHAMPTTVCPVSPMPAQPMGQPPSGVATVAAPVAPSWTPAVQSVPAPPIEKPPAAQAAFIDDPLMHGISPSTKLSRESERQKSSSVGALVGLVFLALVVAAGVGVYKYYPKLFKGLAATSPGSVASSPAAGSPLAPASTPGQAGDGTLRGSTAMATGTNAGSRTPGTGSKRPVTVAQAPAVGGAKPKAEAPEANSEAPGAANPSDTSKAAPDAKPAGPADPAKQKAFKQALAGARIALSQRDQAGLNRYLTLAGHNAQGPDDQAAIQRMRLMGQYLEKYWQGIGRMMAQLVTAEEIIVGKERISVVESDATAMTVHVQGQNYTYKVAQLPRVLMFFLAERLLNKEPAAKTYYGVYLAISPNGDRDRARALLEEAAKQDSEVEKLLPELDEAPVPSGPVAAAKKSAPPEKAKLDEVLRTIHEKYKADYDQATTPTGKDALAKILLDNGRTSMDDLDLRFGLLTAARKEAIAAGDAALACQAVDEIDALHAIDAFQMKVTTLEELGQAAHGLTGHRDIAQAALTMANAAMDANRLDEASRLAKLAISAAQKAKNAPLAKQARMTYLQIENLRKQK